MKDSRKLDLIKENATLKLLLISIVESLDELDREDIPKSIVNYIRAMQRYIKDWLFKNNSKAIRDKVL